MKKENNKNLPIWIGRIVGLVYYYFNFEPLFFRTKKITPVHVGMFIFFCMVAATFSLTQNSDDQQSVLNKIVGGFVQINGIGMFFSVFVLSIQVCN